VRLSAPATLTQDEHTTPAAIRNISYVSRGWRIGCNEGRSVFSKTKRNYPKLSWKSTTCDAWPALLIDWNRTVGGFATAPFAADLIPKLSMINPLTARLYNYYTMHAWDRNGNIDREVSGLFSALWSAVRRGIVVAMLPNNSFPSPVGAT